MDRRILKTQNALKTAFIELKSKKNINHITVKELCEKANINKSTFYSHYEDIYDFSEKLVLELTKSIIQSIPRDESYTFSNPENFTKQITLAFNKYRNELTILLENNYHFSFSIILEKSLKQVIINAYPTLKDNDRFNIILSYCIQGAYGAQINNPNISVKTQIEVISELVQAMAPVFQKMPN